MPSFGGGPLWHQVVFWMRYQRLLTIYRPDVSIRTEADMRFDRTGDRLVEARQRHLWWLQFADRWCEFALMWRQRIADE